MSAYLIPILLALGLLLAIGLAIAAIYIEFPENGAHAAPRRPVTFYWNEPDRLDVLIARYNLPAIIRAELDDTQELLGRARLALTAGI